MVEDLQNLHCLLKELHADNLQGQGRYIEGGLQSDYLSIAKMKSGYLIEVSNVLFEELVRQSETLNAFLRGPLDGVIGLDSMLQFTKEGFIVLLRCCLMILQFLEFDMSLLWAKCVVLFKVLFKFFPQNLVLNTSGCSGGINEESDQLINFFSLILEVFVAEFSENVGLRKHFFSVDVLAANSEMMLCECPNTHADNCIALKLAFSHFLQLIRKDLDFSRFLHSLSASCYIDKMIPEKSFDVSLKLISTPFILSATHTLQAHLILLASRCISTHLPIDGRQSDTQVTSCCIKPLEMSVNLYILYLSTLQLDGVISGANGRSNLGDSSFNKLTWDESTHQANDLVDFSHLYSEDIFSGSKSEVIGYSASYVRGYHPCIDQLCKEATCLVVDHMIKSIIPMKVWEQRDDENRERIQEKVYCLAAAMKLMNSSLLHIICLLRQFGCDNGTTALNDSFPVMADKLLSQLVCNIRISGCGADQSVQKYLDDMFGDYGGMHQEIKFILAHILSLLIFSFKRKFDFLWKGCISTMMTLMNLLLLEERNLGLSKIFKLLQNPPCIDFEGLTYRSSSMVIARNMKKTQILLLKNEIKYIHVEENRTDADKRSEVDQQSIICSVEDMDYREVHETQGNTCNGESFIKCLPSFHSNPSEWEDLVDFIECMPGKDYFSWLANRNKFNKWKQEKIALSRRWKKRSYMKKPCN